MIRFKKNSDRLDIYFTFKQLIPFNSFHGIKSQSIPLLSDSFKKNAVILLTCIIFFNLFLICDIDQLICETQTISLIQKKKNKNVIALL